ncbi:MAG TPA: DinB family protein [Chloroflexota bacterium]|jgi:hypothetical protein|nr:DinB family protein [Chloroflexota bacterium]
MIDPVALRIVEQTPAVLRGLLAGLPPALLQAPNDEGWSLTDIVAHLHDVENGVMVERIQRLLHEERPFIPSIDPPARLRAGGYAGRTVDELVGDLERLRRAHAAWLTNLAPDEIARGGEHEEVGEIRVADLAHQWAAHDMTHLRQIAFMIQQYLAPLMGNTRAFYDV